MSQHKTIHERLQKAKEKLLSHSYLTKDVKHEDFLSPNREEEIQAMEVELGFRFPDVYRFGLKLHRGLMNSFYSTGWTDFKIQKIIGTHLEDLKNNIVTSFEALTKEIKQPDSNGFVQPAIKELLKHKDQILVLSYTERAISWSFLENGRTYFDGVEGIPFFDFIKCDGNENPPLFQFHTYHPENREKGIIQNAPFCFEDDFDLSIKEKHCTMIDIVEGAVGGLVEWYQNMYYE